MTVDLTPQARAAADWLEDHEWIQGDWGDATTKACLHGAVRSCTPQTGDGYLVSAVLTAKGYSTAWNDEPGRTEGDVLDVLETIEVTDAVLATTFGPNWRLVVTLVRQAATLTPEQANQLAAARAAAGAAAGAAAWDAARAAAWDAAGDAAWAAARAAARAAAGAAARAAARAAAGAAAWDAARAAAGAAAGAAARAAAGAAARAAAWAAVTRDLITPEHYQLLVGPWQSVMGELVEA